MVGFEPVNNAKVTVKRNETWHITASVMTSLSVKTGSADDSAVNNGPRGNSFKSDFSTTEGWKGDIDYIFPHKAGFGSIKSGNESSATILTANKYDFGKEFELSFDLFCGEVNLGHYVNTGNKKPPYLTGNDYSIKLGDFEIQIWNYQSEIKVLYKGEEVKGTSTCFDPTYYTNVTYSYKAQIKPGAIQITSYDYTGCKVVEYTSKFSDFKAVDNVAVALIRNESWQIYHSYIQKLSVSAGITKEDENAKRDAGFETNFKTTDGWRGNTEFIFTGSRGFGSQTEGNEKKAIITTVNRYDFGEKFDASFEVYYGPANQGHYEKEGYKKPPYPTGNDYSIKIGDFEIQLWNYQSEIKILYRGKEIDVTTKYYDKTYGTSITRSYDVHFEPGNIKIVVKNDQGKDAIKCTSKFADFGAVNNATVSLIRKESWQINTSYIRKLRVGTPPAKKSPYKVLYSFNAKEDFAKILSAEDSPRALIKSQWNIWQKNSGITWTTDELSKRNHITGLYTSIPTEPNPIPVMQAKTKNSTSQIGIYNDSLVWRTNNTTSKQQMSALSFEVPATGRIRLYDPEEGLISCVSKLNGELLWWMNNDKMYVKSCYIAIYKNDEKIWPVDQNAFMFANTTHKDVDKAITSTDFPDLLIDVKQGDMIYITVRPEHYAVANKENTQNPTVLSMNPQVDYISMEGEMKLNTDREFADDTTDSLVSSKIKEKSAAIRRLVYDTQRNVRPLIFAGIASGVFVIFMSALTVVVVKRKRRATK